MKKYPRLPNHTLLYPTILFYTQPYSSIPNHTLLYPTIPFYTQPYPSIPNHTLQYPILQYHNLLKPSQNTLDMTIKDSWPSKHYNLKNKNSIFSSFSLQINSKSHHKTMQLQWSHPTPNPFSQPFHFLSHLKRHRKRHKNIHRIRQTWDWEA